MRDIHLMILEYANNEFTTKELLEYVSKAFGCQVNGKPFKSYHISNWIRLRKMPDVYGGYAIVTVETLEGVPNCKLLTIDGLMRDALIDLRRISPPPNNSVTTQNRPRKQRTRLYYELLEKVGKQYTQKSKDAATIPDQWKAIGIKRNQLIN